MIDWKYQQTITDRIEFPQNWTSTGILISISNQSSPTWRKIGYLKIEALIDGEFFTAQYKPIEFGKSLIAIPYSEYRLSFEPVDTLLVLHPNISIKIAEFNLTMYVSPDPNVAPQTAQPKFSTKTPPAATTTGQVRFKLAETLSRRSALITNKTNQVLYIKEGSDASTPILIAGEPFTPIPAGLSYSVEDWSGEIWGILGGNMAAGGKVLIKEMPYLVAEAVPTVTP